MPTLAQIYLSNDLRVTCRVCGHVGVLDTWALGQRVGWDADVNELAPRMQCAECRKKACAVELIAMNRRRKH